jgi:hypothetical protein
MYMLDHYLQTDLSPDYFYDDAHEQCAAACYGILASGFIIAAAGFSWQLALIQRHRQGRFPELYSGLLIGAGSRVRGRLRRKPRPGHGLGRGRPPMLLPGDDSYHERQLDHAQREATVAQRLRDDYNDQRDEFLEQMRTPEREPPPRAYQSSPPRSLAAASSPLLHDGGDPRDHEHHAGHY